MIKQELDGKYYFLIKIAGDAVEDVAAAISPKTALDIDSMSLISREFNSDISAIAHLDNSIGSIAKINKRNGKKVAIDEWYNPLYLPNSMEKIEQLFDTSSTSASTLTYTGDGHDANPFAIKSISLKCGDDIAITAKVACKPFDLPSYNEIVDNQQSTLLQ